MAAPLDKAESPDVEEQKLVAADSTQYGALPRQTSGEKPEDSLDADSMNYDARKLVTFSVLQDFKGTVWAKGSLWEMMKLLSAIAVAVALCICFVVHDAEKIDAGKFRRISTFLSVVVGLLLGFFLSSSIQRWYSCINGFLALFDSIRVLQVQLSALGVPQERIQMCLRYGVLSAYCINMDLAKSSLPPDEQKALHKDFWDSRTIPQGSEVPVDSRSIALVFHEERVLLDQCEDASQTIWVWVSSLLTRMSADGEIPPMPSPTYGRILGLAEGAYNGIREVRSSVSVQPPYVYVQMLALLVTVNNIINATSFGMTLGLAVRTLLESHGLIATTPFEVQSYRREARTGQDLIICLIMSMIGPFLYQAVLEVSVCIAQPFANSSGAGRIPTERMLSGLERDLRDASLLSKNLPWWDQPTFKTGGK
eukprot:TRINITY_DN2592_c0_g1_i1.p1 TRINITY_DN2592_c0_g1~~TRINITY_DN2592_c0_g1_i1.p1  ORF type:complete len:423 (+),score=84.63 TRINITY_DN2592_c0_g1_i1:102-1370(+)